MKDLEYRHLIAKARDAQQGGRDAWAVQSTGEKVAVALVLNRADRGLDLFPQAHPLGELERQAVLPPHDFFNGRLQLVLAV